MTNENKPGLIFAIAGKDDSRKGIEWGLTRSKLGQKYEHEVHIVPHGDNGESLEDKLIRMYQRIEDLTVNYNVIPFGFSAGASHAFLAVFSPEVGHLIKAGVGVGRYRVGKERGYRSIENRSKGAKTFGDAVQKVDSLILSGAIAEYPLEKFITFLSPYDQLVRREDGQIPGVRYESIVFDQSQRIPVPEHILSMAMVIMLPVNVEKILSHIEFRIKNED